MSWLAREGAVFLLAVQFLTRLPLPADVGFTPERLAAAPRYYPLVGALVGCLGAAVAVAAGLVLPPAIAVLASMLATVLLTGAFHEDGLADMADGVGGGATREQALEIMRDSRIGTYGACALLGVLALKAAALMALPAEALPWALIAGHGLSRYSSVLAIATSRYAREAGTAKPVATGVSAPGLAVVTLTAAGLVFLWAAAGGPWPAALTAVVGLGLGHLAARAAYECKLGGYTGDCLGAVQQLSEVGFYLGAVVWISS